MSFLYRLFRVLLSLPLGRMIFPIPFVFYKGLYQSGKPTNRKYHAEKQHDTGSLWFLSGFPGSSQQLIGAKEKEKARGRFDDHPCRLIKGQHFSLVHMVPLPFRFTAFYGSHAFKWLIAFFAAVSRSGSGRHSTVTKPL